MNLQQVFLEFQTWTATACLSSVALAKEGCSFWLRSLLRTVLHWLPLRFSAADSPAFAEATADKQGCVAESGSRAAAVQRGFCSQVEYNPTWQDMRSCLVSRAS
jgi:hypothetical protein